MDEFPVCKVDFKLDKQSVYAIDSEYNEAQIKAIAVSKSVFVNGSYYDIESLAFNNETERLEVFLK